VKTNETSTKKRVKFDESYVEETNQEHEEEPLRFGPKPLPPPSQSIAPVRLEEQSFFETSSIQEIK
jgi:hypothetical protein